jgi:acetyl-CoA carboxylase biotin carboxylase subunit
VEIARAVGYQNAERWRFLLTRDGRFFFMEMNARIQGSIGYGERLRVDLIKGQLQVALGHHIRVSQENLIARGHAIECRINAGCPAEGFPPRPGVIRNLQLPGGNGIRIDSGYAPEMNFAILRFYGTKTHCVCGRPEEAFACPARRWRRFK